MSSHRLQRVESELRKELSLIFSDFLKDPRITMATATRARVSRDLRHAKVWVSVVGDTATVHEVMMVLRNAAHSIRMELARRMTLRRVPELDFVYDDAVDHSMRIGGILADLALERDAEAGPDEDEEARDSAG